MSSYSESLTPLTSTSPFRSAYSQKLRMPLTFPEDSPHTKQSFRDECDINTIMARYMSTGELPEVDARAPQYLDVSAGADFQSAMEFIAGAKTMFQELPSELRTRFDNDPKLFLDFVGDPKNRSEMADLGLLSDEAVRDVAEERLAVQTALEARKATPNTSVQNQTLPDSPVEKKD